MAKITHPPAHELLRDLRELTSRQFVYEDGWCGMVPFDGELSELQTGPSVPFAELTWREQADVLRSFIHWHRYPERDWDDEYTIRQNIEAAKPLERWLEGTSLGQSFQLLAEGKTPPPAKQSPEITWEDVATLLHNPAAVGTDQPPANAETAKLSQATFPPPQSTESHAGLTKDALATSLADQLFSQKMPQPESQPEPQPTHQRKNSL